VRGASRIAAVAGISPLVVGLTVVAFGTSSPELAVSIGAGLAGRSDIAVGNVVGSNVFNVLFILGLSATLAPLRVDQQLIWLDVPIMIAVSLLVFLLGSDGVIGRVEGIALLSGVLGYTAFLIRTSRRETEAVREEYAREFAPPLLARRAVGWVRDGAMVAGGLGALVLGGHWLVESAVSLARGLGVSELVIALTVVAVGTSLPELATSVVASLRGERDIAVGNVVGSNIFNLLAVLGAAAAVSPAGVAVSPAALRFDIPVMVAVSVACLPIFTTGHRIDRWEGLLFLGYYGAYTAYLVLRSLGHPSLPLFGIALAGFVLPLSVLALATSFFRAARRGPEA